ncbi:MAG: amidohydrolase family protein [Dehalococcoidia bacterium]
MTNFYDAHCHMMNLSHPNLSVVLKRIFKEQSALDRMKISFGTFLLAIPFVGPALPSLVKADDRAMNLLALMETELGDYMLQMEEDLRNTLNWGGGPVVFGKDEKREYDKIVLTPLIMDFGLKSYEKAGTLYKVRWKPIASQVLDVCLGIKYYYKNRYEYELPGANPKAPLFEIHPFMGINTRNYAMSNKTLGTSSSLETLLSKNFTGFADDTTATRRANLAVRNWMDFTGDLDTIKPYDFIGIKVYPPLGYNPWPTETWEKNAADEMEKVRYLYDFCQSNNIPITAHCSNGGFLADRKYAKLAHPEKWATVLDNYPNLRLNLAHFGAANKGWRKAIAELILKHDNVYTDISYRGVNKKYYEVLRKFLDGHTSDERKKLMERIIFGSDFMINLMSIDSYRTYMKYFAETLAFTAAEKDLLCSKNTERFLFLGTL